MAITFFFSALVLAGCIGPKTPLGRAVDSDDMQEVQNLLARGADPCEKTSEYTAFDWAQGDNRELLESDAIKTELYRVLLEKHMKDIVMVIRARILFSMQHGWVTQI